MAPTPREIVRRCLKFDFPPRLPRDLWLLPWAELHHPQAVQTLREHYPTDFAAPDFRYPPSPRIKGDPHVSGEYTDEWDCVFKNIQAGVIGEVKNPLIADIADWQQAAPPYEQLPRHRQAALDRINRSCAASDKFIIANICPRPWERYQFLRGTENALVDVMMQERGVRELLRRIHDFYLTELEFWVHSEVDAIMFMDDWGSQSQLLIPPPIWRDLFKPLYRDYCDLAHANGKFAFMHSDGHILAIYEDLIEDGVDAINSQLFCMDLTELARLAKGRITFWGEIDRQHILPSPDPRAGRAAVRLVAEQLYDRAGGIIAQFEFGAGANPETALAIFDEWEKVAAESRVSRP